MEVKKKTGAIATIAMIGAATAVGAGVAALQDKTTDEGKTNKMLACPWCDPEPCWPGDECQQNCG